MTMRESFEKWWSATMNTQVMDLHRFFEGYTCHETNRSWMAWQAAFNMQQAEIDRLMLEFCPNEMSKEQMDEWAKHQKRAPEEFQNV